MNDMGTIMSATVYIFTPFLFICFYKDFYYKKVNQTM